MVWALVSPARPRRACVRAPAGARCYFAARSMTSATALGLVRTRRGYPALRWPVARMAAIVIGIWLSRRKPATTSLRPPHPGDASNAVGAPRYKASSPFHRETDL
jgi:hypothetical protein